MSTASVGALVLCKVMYVSGGGIEDQVECSRGLVCICLSRLASTVPAVAMDIRCCFRRPVQLSQPCRPSQAGADLLCHEPDRQGRCSSWMIREEGTRLQRRRGRGGHGRHSMYLHIPRKEPSSPSPSSVTGSSTPHLIQYRSRFILPSSALQDAALTQPPSRLFPH